MTILLVLIGVGFAIFLAAIYGAVETAAYGASETRLRVIAEAHPEGADAALSLTRHLTRLVTTTLIGHNLAVYLGTYILTLHIESRHIHNAEAVATAMLTPFCFIFAEVLPKRLAHARPNRSLVAAARTAAISQRIFVPLGFLLGGVAALLQGGLKRLGYQSESAEGRQKLKEYLDAGVAEGLLSEHQHQVAQRIMTLQETTLRDVMIPLGRALLVREDETCRDAARRMLQGRHNRAPLVDRAGKPVGRMVTLNAILRAPSSLDQPVASCGYEALSLDANTPLVKALRRLQESNGRLAVVLGRGGGAVGIVTVSDLISSIMGAMRL